MRDRKEVGLDARGGRENLGSIWGGKLIIRIYYMKKSIFNK
jgi:hypothetical protein